MDQDTDYLVTGSDLHANVKTFDAEKDTEYDIKSGIRKEWFKRNIRPILEDKFNSIDFVTLSKSGVSHLMIYSINPTCCFDLWNCDALFWNCVCCCSCVDCFSFFPCSEDDSVCRDLGCYGTCCGNIIEQYFSFLFKSLFKKDTCYAKTVHGLKISEILDVVESVSEELIQGSTYDFIIDRRRGCIFIKW